MRLKYRLGQLDSASVPLVSLRTCSQKVKLPGKIVPAEKKQTTTKTNLCLGGKTPGASKPVSSCPQEKAGSERLGVMFKITKQVHNKPMKGYKRPWAFINTTTQSLSAAPAPPKQQGIGETTHQSPLPQ